MLVIGKEIISIMRYKKYIISSQFEYVYYLIQNLVHK